MVRRAFGQAGLILVLSVQLFLLPALPALFVSVKVLCVTGLVCWIAVPALSAVFLADSVVGGSYCVRQLFAARRLRRSLLMENRWPVHAVRAVARAGLHGKVSLVRDPGLQAFTHGVLRPRISVSTGLVERLAEDELVAILRHEECHLKAADPLRFLVLRTAGVMTRPLPAVSTWLTQRITRRELLADRYAVQACGVRPVASALLTALRQPDPLGGAALSAFTATPDALEDRLVQLETGVAPRRLAAGHRDRTASVVGLVLLVLAVTALFAVCGESVGHAYK